MSDEKNTAGEGSSAEGLFDSLIEDFNLTQSGETPEIPSINEDEKPRTMRDFSKFFNDAKASGSGFESTIDKINNDKINEQKSSEIIDFTEPKAKITEPVTDEDGMIVIFDDEAGIDATASGSAALSHDVSDSADGNISDKKDESETETDASYDSSDNFAPDDNVSEITIKEALSDDSETAAVSESNADNSDSPAEAEKKAPFISRILPWKGDGVAEIIRKIVFLVAVIVFIAAGIMLISTLMQSKEMQEESARIEEMVTTTVATTVNDVGEIVTVPPTTEERIQHNVSVMDSFVEISSDVKGFIELPGCGIYLPVVQSKDNDYYLTRTYDGRKNKAGSIFIDYRCTVTEEYTSPNIILYGHNQEDGTMFGNLKYYKNNVDFYKSNPTVVFNTDFGIGDYVIFGYFITNVHEYQDTEGEVFHYHDYIETLADENTFNWYMNEVQERNQIIPPVDVTFGDKLLVLSTCSNEYSDSRFVVMARKLRENEKISDYDFTAARLNPFAKQIDWSLILSDSDSSISDTVTESETTVSEETTVPETTEETTAETTTEETTEETTTEETTTTEKTYVYTGTYPTGPTGPIETAPAQSAPDVTAPAQSAPAVTAPAQSAPAVTAPAQSAPDVTAPAQSAPDVTAPVQPAPDVTAPVQPAPDVTAPAVTAPAQMLSAE